MGRWCRSHTLGARPARFVPTAGGCHGGCHPMERRGASSRGGWMLRRPTAPTGTAPSTARGQSRRRQSWRNKVLRRHCQTATTPYASTTGIHLGYHSLARVAPDLASGQAAAQPGGRRSGYGRSAMGRGPRGTGKHNGFCTHDLALVDGSAATPLSGVLVRPMEDNYPTATVLCPKTE